MQRVIANGVISLNPTLLCLVALELVLRAYPLLLGDTYANGVLSKCTNREGAASSTTTPRRDEFHDPESHDDDVLQLLCVDPRDGNCHSSSCLSRSAFAIADTELRLIAALASIGESSKPNTGYKTPAAIGTPRAL